VNIAVITLVSSTSPNGLSNYIKCLINALKQVDEDNTYYIYANKEFASFLNLNHPRFKVVLVNIPHFPRLVYRPVYFFWQNFISPQSFIKNKIDLVHLPNPIPFIYKPSNIPFVTTIHDLVEIQGLRHNKLHRLFRIFASKSSANNSEYVLTVSDHSKSEIVNHFNLDPENVIRVYPSTSITSDNKKPNRLGFQKPFFLHVGGKKNNKNTDRLIQSFIKSKLNKKYDLRLIGDVVTGFKRLEKDGIYHDGVVEESKLKSYYSEAICLVYPSLSEGFGLPIIEAMSFGTPVITSKIGAMPEVAGEAAILIDPYNEHEITNALKLIASDIKLREDYKQKGLDRAQFFSWEKCALETINVYEKAIKRFKFT
jgi:glycosyltransferase involved in cell wall biosynthesis